MIDPCKIRLKAGCYVLKEIYILPTQHFDLIWRKSGEYYRSVRSRVIKKSLQILKRYPEYRFYLDQAEVISEFLEQNPECADDLTEALQSGRFAICGGGWSLIDTNMVCGESIVRNLLYGRQWFKEKFGIDVTTGSYVDTFGMCGQLPQIMKKLGDGSCVPGRTPGGDGKYQYGDYGCFLWEGIDGTNVVSGIGALGQMSWEGMSGFDGYGVMEGFDDLYRQKGDDPVLARQNIGAGLRDLMKVPGDVFYTEYTGEEHMPSDLLPSLVEEQNRASEDCRFHISTPDEFFSRVDQSKLPVVKGEFNPVFTGCYTTRIEIKQGIRRAENALLSEESLLVLIKVLSGAQLENSLKNAWRDLSYAEFHDAICGCHIDESSKEIYKKIDCALQMSGENQKAAKTAADLLKAPCGSFVVFNTLGFSRKDIVLFPGVHCVQIVDESGEIVPSCDEEEGTKFVASLPAMGYCCYRTLPAWRKVFSNRLEAGLIDTLRYRVKVEPQRLFVYDKLLCTQLDTDEVPLGNLVFAEDSGNLWVERLTGKKIEESKGKIRLLSEEENDVFYRVSYEGEIAPNDLQDKSWDGAQTLRWQKQYVFYRKLDRIDLKVTVSWSGKNSTVLAEYPCAFVAGEGQAWYEVPFGSQKRTAYEPDYQKNTGGSWPAVNSADFSDASRGLTVVNTGTPSYRISDKKIQVTLLRSGSDWTVPAFPFEPEVGSFDSGTHEFLFSVVPHLHSWSESGAFKTGMAVNRTPEAAEILHEGEKLPSEFSMLKISDPDIILSACKMSENGDAIAVRLYELSGRTTKVEMKLAMPVRYAVETDLTETKEIAKADLSNLSFQPYEIKTILLYL